MKIITFFPRITNPLAMNILLDTPYGSQTAVLCQHGL